MSYPHDQHNPATVLLIDDYPFMRQVLRHILEKGGYLVIAESNCCAGEALDKYLRHRPTITVLDASVRRKDSLEVAKAIFSHDSTAAVILCDFDAGETAGLAETVGACGVLVKPYTAAQVLQAMQAARENIQGQ